MFTRVQTVYVKQVKVIHFNCSAWYLPQEVMINYLFTHFSHFKYWNNSNEVRKRMEMTFKTELNIYFEYFNFPVLYVEHNATYWCTNEFLSVWMPRYISNTGSMSRQHTVHFTCENIINWKRKCPYYWSSLFQKLQDALTF